MISFVEKEEFIMFFVFGRVSVSLMTQQQFMLVTCRRLPNIQKRMKKLKGVPKHRNMPLQSQNYRRILKSKFIVEVKEQPKSEIGN